MNTTQANSKRDTRPRTFTVPLPEALYLAEVGLSGASDDDVTPVITAAVWMLKGDTIETLSTDRYRVHRARIEAPGVGEAVLGMPRDALTWLTKNRAYFRRGSSVLDPIVTIDVTYTETPPGPAKAGIVLKPGQVTLTIGDTLDDRSINLRTNLIRGSFPPVDRLFDTARDAEEVPGASRINLDFMAKTKALAVDRREMPPLLKFTKHPDNPGRPGPLLLTYARGEALIQPNLLAER